MSRGLVPSWYRVYAVRVRLMDVGLFATSDPGLYVHRSGRKLVEWGYLPFDPTGKVVDLPDDSELRVRYLSVPEYELMLQKAEEIKALPSFSLGIHFQFLAEYVMLGCSTGLRPGELLHLEGRDIDIDGRKLRVRRKPELGFHPKSYHEREVPLNNHAFSAVTSLLGQRAGKSDFLFHHRDGNRVKTVREAFDVLTRKSQLQGVIPYTLRHTIGAWGVKAGISMRILQKLMGHLTIVVTERYSHVANDDMAAAVNRINYFYLICYLAPQRRSRGDKYHKSNGIMVPKGGVEPP